MITVPMKRKSLMYNHDSVATGLGVATAISLAVIFVLRQVPAWWSDKNMKM